MNKQWYQSLYAWTHPTFLISGDEESTPMTLDIRLVDRDGEGKKSMACDQRYVKLCDPLGEGTIYPLCLEKGEAYLRLEHAAGKGWTLMQCDENGHRLPKQGRFAPTYELNGTMIQGDEINMDETKGNQRIDITDMASEPLTLHLCKKLVNEHEEPLDFAADMRFAVHLRGCGEERRVVLDMDNGFHAVLNDLHAGRYEIWEENKAGECLLSLDEQAACEDQWVMLPGGMHTLELIEQHRSGNVLMLDQYIRCENGELIKPQENACFFVQVKGECFEERYTLNRENDFSLRLCDLPKGCYDIIAEDCNGDVSYLVNANPKSDTAQVQLGTCTQASVLIICQRQTEVGQSPLRICKYVRRSDNTLVKPDPQENFRVMLQGCGVCEIFHLNAYNNFCVDIGHLCYGEYEVRELNHEGYVASYVVNDGCESTNAVIWMQEGMSNCVTIINEERNKGEITISKVIRQGDGSLVKPEKTARFLVTLRSVFCRETYVLDSDNDFCAHIHHLKEGSYEIKERKVDGFDTTYMINGGREEYKARFVVRNNTCNDIRIINSVRREVFGDLRICKFIANAYGDYVKPQSDEEFMIRVEGPCLDACYTLRAANRWSILLEGLKKGVYRIRETDNDRYDTQYFVNGNEMSEAALVCMDKQNQDVVIVNTKHTNGNLKLNVMTQDCDGERHKPSRTQFFAVILESNEGSKEIVLDQKNNFGVLLEDMPRGKVRVMQKDSYGYRVLYEVNGKCQNHGEVIMNGENASITIINQMMNCSGVLRVRKLIKTLHGHIMRPCARDCYDFLLESRCMHQEFSLHEQNSFCVMFDDLEEGDYELKEKAVPGMVSSYRINGAECDNGRFTLGRDDIDIEVINTVLPLPKLYVNKRIRKHGTLMKPQAHESFHFQLIGRDMHETYCLNEENDWCVCIEELPSRHYEIREMHAQGCVMYQIDDCLQEKGNFRLGDEDKEITIINEASGDNLVRINKMMRDINGEMHKPCGNESFEAVLESDCYKQCFTLEERNDWCVEIEGLPEGRYRVSQLGEEPYEVWINGCRREDQMLQLMDQDVSVTLISPLGCENALILRAHCLQGEERLCPAKDRSYHITITHEGVSDHFTLDETNDFAISLNNIRLGEYRIAARENMLYEACGEWFTCAIDVEMGCGELCVNLYEEIPCRNNRITIRKRRCAQANDACLPDDDVISDVLLCGHKEECFTLSCDNHWCVQCDDYPKGSYEVIEMGHEDVCYQINGEIAPNGRFTLNDQDIDILILPNRRQNECAKCEKERFGGALSLHALIQNGAGELESAAKDATFDVQISGARVAEDITLNERNGFLMRYAHLPMGSYRITAAKQPQYEWVGMRVQGEMLKTDKVELGNADLQVDLIFAPVNQRGSIHVMKYLRDESCGCLKRPCMDEEYEIRLSGAQTERTAVLNKDNKWSYLFDRLPDGTYMVEEIGETPSAWIINNSKEQREARIELRGEIVGVKLINDPPCENAGYGALELCKYNLDENGEKCTPDETESCWVSVKGAQDTHRILLHAANHFYARLPHLPNGQYEIMQEDDASLSYMLNNQPCTRAVADIRDNECNVDILEACGDRPSISLVKLIQDQNGTLAPAQSGAYRIHVSASGFNQVVILDAQNNYHAVLKHLRKGLYVVDELDHEHVSYIVDHGSQVDRAIVDVRKAHEVAIINPKQSGGSIRFTKYIRNEAGLLVRPDAKSSYEFHISKPNYHEKLVLNADNAWSAQLHDLRDGNYVIQEIGDQQVSYIINDGSECDYGIVNVKGNANTVTIINREVIEESGSIRIMKYVRDEDGSLRRPHGERAFEVRVYGRNYQKHIRLDRSNDWQMQLDDLADGDYVLDEVDNAHEVTWRVDGSYEVDRCVVHVSHDAHQVEMINHAAVSDGNILHIQKFMRNASGELLQPRPRESFTFLLDGPKKTKLILNADNAWTAHLEGLANGSYTLKEVNEDDSIVYEINGKPHQKAVPFSLNGERVDVHVINEQKPQNPYVLDLFKYMKKDSGGLMRPADGDCFHIEVSGDQYRENFTLEAANRFHVRITDLKRGTYRIEELRNEAYITTYRINGNEEKQALINVKQQRSDVVEIINELAVNRSVADIFKYRMDAKGQLNQPDPRESFRILLTGNNMHRFYTLDQGNDWHIQLDTLAAGEYEIIEQGMDNDRVWYRINGAPDSRSGEFTVSGGSDNLIEIINQSDVPSDGVINLEKRVRDENGDLITPANGENFMVRVWRDDNRFDVTYTLDPYNGYSLSVEGLIHGTYHIREVDTSGYGVTYVVNGQAESSSADVTISDERHHQVTIINTKTDLFFHVNQGDGLRVVIE